MTNSFDRGTTVGNKGSTMVCAHLFISGRVQGIGFRESARRAALQRGVVGWVRNLLDGRVEAWLEGPSSAVQSMIAWCREGPPLARVDDVEITWEQPTGRYWTFSVTSNE